MKIIYKKGSVVNASEKFILHGCNCQGVMGSGVAKALKEKWPEVYVEYKRVEKDGGLVLGDCHYVKVGPDKWVINAITQQFYGRDPKTVYIDYDAIRQVIFDISYTADVLSHPPLIAMPKIGAGLGGGDWDIISKIIEDESRYFQPVVYTL